MSSVFVFGIFYLISGGLAQFPGASLFSSPWGQGSGSSNPGSSGGSGGPPIGRPAFGKPVNFPRPSSLLPYGSSSYSSSGGSGNGNRPYNDDPIPAPSNLESSYDTQTLPAKLPIQAPNGVVEIYNRVVDDLISRLKVDFKKREIDPMSVVIRPTPAGPVRVPGHLQKRPFRRPGAALYRSTIPSSGTSSSGNSGSPNIKRKSRVNDISEANVPQEDLKPSYRGAGKVSSPNDPVAPEVDGSSSSSPSEGTPTTMAAIGDEEVKAPIPVPNKSEEISSEESVFFRSRSDEYFPGEDIEDLQIEDKNERAEKRKKNKKDEKEGGSDEDEAAGTKSKGNKDKDKGDGKDVDTLMQRYQNKNGNENSNKSKVKYTGTKKKEEPVKKPIKSEEQDDEEEDDEDENDDIEPGTHQSGGNRPLGGYYPNNGQPVVPSKPNAALTGLSNIKRASDVAVSVDARSAVITARLLVGPLNVYINESMEPMEKNVRATIPELEAELMLMERHGVVFLQRFTLDRAYGKDVEISIPKNKSGDKNKNKLKGIMAAGSGGPGGLPPPPLDPNHPMHPGAQQRFQTKMAAHISMEIVKLLRSGNLRVNIMRTAQGSMSKLKLPIQKPKSGKKKNKKSGKKDDNDE